MRVNTVRIHTVNSAVKKQDLNNAKLGFIAYETSYEKYKVVDVFSNGKEESRTLKQLLSKYKAKYTINANDGTL